MNAPIPQPVPYSVLNNEALRPLPASGEGGNDVFNTIQQRWLSEELGLSFDPFAPERLDAGKDPLLPQYLVGKRATEFLWGDWLSFLFAPPGGGKTAFRVWLTRFCRTGWEGRRILPIPYRPPRPIAPSEPPSWEEYEATLRKATATSVLIELAYRPAHFLGRGTSLEPHYRPSCFLALGDEEKRLFRGILERDLPIPLDYLLDQLADEGNLTPLSRAFDPPSLGLPNEPQTESVRAFCNAMRATPASDQLPQGWEKTIAFLRGTLRYEAVYLLIDEADAYTQEKEVMVRLLEPLWDKTTAWAEQAVFTKFFLPSGMESVIPNNLLTGNAKWIIIQWDSESLIQVVRERLRVASKGAFDSLKAISAPDVHADIEYRLAQTLRPSVPREMLRLVERVFYSHVRRVGAYGLLEMRDYQEALEWYPGR